jgi:hypothetical protein
MEENPYQSPAEVNNAPAPMRIGRIVVLVFCALLATLNGPLFLYYASIDRMTPYGYHSRSLWLLSAATNVAVGLLGIWWALRRRSKG